MALGTVFRETSLRMVWIRRRSKFLGMTAETVRGSSFESASGMAGVAVKLCVGSGESKMRKLRMVKTRSLPAVDVMAGFAGGWQAGLAMVNCGRVLVIRQMARDTGRTQARENTGGRPPVTGLAIRSRMCP